MAVNPPVSKILISLHFINYARQTQKVFSRVMTQIKSLQNLQINSKQSIAFKYNTLLIPEGNLGQLNIKAQNNNNLSIYVKQIHAFMVQTAAFIPTQ